MPSTGLWLALELPWLDPTDAELCEMEPLKSALSDWGRHHDGRGYPQWKGDLSAKLLGDPLWVRRIRLWLAFCTHGVELASIEAIDTFVDVIFMRQDPQIPDDRVIERLIEAQQRYMALPTSSKYSVFSTELPEENDGEEDDADAEEDLVEGMEGMHLIKDDEEFLQLCWCNKKPSVWRRTLYHHPHYQDVACTYWARWLRKYFDEEVSEIADLKKVIECLQQMRAIRATTWRLESWAHAIKQSGLVEVLIDVYRPTKILFITTPHIIESYRCNVWREAMGELLYRWTPEMVRELAESVASTPLDMIDDGSPRERCTVESILKCMSDNPDLIPCSTNPTSVFFLVTLENFTAAWHLWLKHALYYYGINTGKVDLKKLHRYLRGTHLTAEFLADHHWLNPILKVILEETHALVHQNTQVVQNGMRPPREGGKYDGKSGVGNRKPCRSPGSAHKSSHHSPKGSLLPSLPCSFKPETLTQKTRSPDFQAIRLNKPYMNNCPFCRDLPEDEWCTRPIQVSMRADLEVLMGHALTCAPEDDRPRQKMTKKAAKHEIPFHHPDELGLQPIEHRPTVYDRCRKDVNLLIHDQYLVGAVKFRAFHEDVLNEMSEHNKTCLSLRRLTRAATFESFAYGSMRAIGSRLPQGGKPGDGYAAYADLSADTEEDIRRLFRHARANDAMFKAARTIYPPATKNIGKGLVAEGLNPLGSTGSNLYICDNFMSPIHEDDDVDISVCAQIHKRCKPVEWNFAYLKWGRYISTIPNTLWLFYGSHAHGTIMPFQSTIDKANSLRRSRRLIILGLGGDAEVDVPVSTGDHATTRNKDRRRATLYQSVRNSFAGIARYWTE